MIRQQLLASAAIAIALSTSALAADVETLETAKSGQQGIAQQCLGYLQAIDRQLNDVGFGVLPPGGYGLAGPAGYGFLGTPREDIQALRSAALVMAYEGDQEACQQVLSKMHETFEEHQKLVGLEADDPEVRSAWRRAHLANAKPITEMDRLMRADVVIGADLRKGADQARCLKRQLSLPVSTMSQWWVSRSRSAVVILQHAPAGELLVHRLLGVARQGDGVSGLEEVAEPRATLAAIQRVRKPRSGTPAGAPPGPASRGRWP